MNSLRNIRLPWRLGMGFALVLSLVLVMAGAGTAMLQRVNGLGLREATTSDQLVLLTEWQALTELNLTRTLTLLKAGESQALRELLAMPMKTTTAQIGSLRERIEQLSTDNSDRALLAAVGQTRKAYIGMRDELFARLKAGDLAGASADADSRLAPLTLAYVDSVRAVKQQLSTRLAADRAAQDVAMQQAQQLLLGLALTALLLGALLSWLITRSVVGPLRAAIASTQRVAAGDLRLAAQASHRDEVGELAQALDTMGAGLSAALHEVMQASHSIHAASQEVASANLDLSQRTEAAAGSLQQTASAAEQLGGAASSSADAARQASTLAGSVSHLAQQGGAAVALVVDTMDQINASSRRIADIVGTIDGIAFQTNILALNAAVEAARAGEQGRGFAVVAAEVRALAQRSATAARQIKGLIGSSVERVQAGTRQVADAGSSMTELVAGVQRVHQIIDEISLANSEQHGGIGQVNAAVADIDRMTQQNAAMVEESAAAAAALNAQAGRLAGLVGRFQLRPVSS